MPVIIKEMRIRTVIEKRIVTDAEISEEIIRKIEDRVLDRLSAGESGHLAEQGEAQQRNPLCGRQATGQPERVERICALPTGNLLIRMSTGSDRRDGR